jgi:formylglycine-generating enzyme required for sulfatase activity
MALLVACLISASTGLALAQSEAALPAVGTTFHACPDCPEMVVIPAGTFLMGSSDADSERDYAAMNHLERLFGGRYLAKEHPRHQVRIGHAFGLGKYLVTRGQFAAFVQATGYTSAGGCIFYYRVRFTYHSEGSWRNPGFQQTDQDPVVWGIWPDTQAYVDWLNAKLQENIASFADARYRLPSEAEWECAARAGQQTARWWGDDIGTDNADCMRCGSLWDGKGTAPVGSFRPNQFGLYDVLGNAGEWTQDCWQINYEGVPSDGR